MSYPEYDELKNALLCFIFYNGDQESDCSIAAKATYDPLADYFDLTEHERKELHGENDFEWRNRVQFAKNFLKEEGRVLDNHPSRPTIWRLSELGQNRAQNIRSNYRSLDRKYFKKAADISKQLASNKRVETFTYRIIRDTKLSRNIKQLYQNKCQVCDNALELYDSDTYSEAHHIRPLGEPHNGPDIKGNILCVCPNHHAQLDFGAIPLYLDELTLHPLHKIDQEYLTYHNDKINGK